jgi:membrane-associated HD superfamily phosphohydrolase
VLKKCKGRGDLDINRIYVNTGMSIEIIGLIVLYIIILLIDMPRLVKKKSDKKELIVYLSIIITGFIVSMMQVIFRGFPSITRLLENISILQL